MAPDPEASPRWRSAHEVLAEWEAYETNEWARITGGIPTQRSWPPRLSKAVLTSS